MSGEQGHIVSDAVSASKEQYNKALVFILALPFIVAPIAGVHFPKINAFVLPVCGLFGLVAYVLSYRAIPPLPKGLVIFILGALAVVTLSLINIPDNDDSIERVKKLWILMPFSAVFVALCAAGKTLPTQKLFRVVKIICAIAACILTADLLTGSPFYKYTRDMSDSDPFSTAVYNKGAIITALMGLSAFLIEKKTRLDYLLVLPLFVMLACVQSQAVQIGAAVLFVIYFFYPYIFKYKALWIVTFLIIVAGGMGKPFIVSYLYEYCAKTLSTTPVMNQAYAAHRLEIWDYVAKEVWSSPFWGHGIEFTRSYEGFESAKQYLPSASTTHPHSFIMQLWIEFGVGGVILALTAIGWFMRSIYNISDNQTKRTALSALLVMLFMADITFGLWQSWWLVFMFMLTAFFALANRRT